MIGEQNTAVFDMTPAPQDATVPAEDLANQYKVYVFVNEGVSPSMITGPMEFFTALNQAGVDTSASYLTGVDDHPELNVVQDESGKVISIMGFNLDQLEFYHG